MAVSLDPIAFVRDTPPFEHLYVVRKGAVRLERDAQTLQVLEEGEVFGFTSLISGKATLDVRVEEDLLAYRLPKATFEALLGNAPFAGHFASGLAERLRNSLERSQVVSFQPDLAVPVSSLLRGPAVRIAPGSTVGDAARVMADQSVSSVLVDSDPPGIVTDRDFRRRVLAAGRGPETPVLDVCSSPLKTVEADCPVYEAWRILLDAGCHHLPVTRDGEIIGVLSATDLLKTTASGPLAVMKRVERLGDRSALPGYSTKVAEMASVLFNGGLEPTVIGGFVARLNDTLLTRILRWAEAELGPPPTPYAWVVFGSEGRMEQMVLTDQDNALVYGDDTPEARAYFAALAEKAVTDLEAAGFPHCPGGYMATRWHGPLDEWEERFRTWLDRPTPQALLEASIFFDLRPVYGHLDVARLRTVVGRAKGARTFLSAMAKSALTFHVPSGLGLRLRSDSAKFDMKLKGISPIVFLARVYGLEAASRTSNTLDRLRYAADAGLFTRDTSETLSEAYRFLLRVRLREQIKMISEGKPPSNMIALSDLSSMERSRVRDAFRAIEVWHDHAAYHFRTDMF